MLAPCRIHRRAADRLAGQLRASMTSWMPCASLIRPGIRTPISARAAPARRPARVRRLHRAWIAEASRSEWRRWRHLALDSYGRDFRALKAAGAFTLEDTLPRLGIRFHRTP